MFFKNLQRGRTNCWIGARLAPFRVCLCNTTQRNRGNDAWDVLTGWTQRQCSERTRFGFMLAARAKVQPKWMLFRWTSGEVIGLSSRADGIETHTERQFASSPVRVIAE